MSRVDDLIDLIQATNEIYLINPSRNIRSAYIQIDDICELVMKSYLPIVINNWTPISHQHNGRDYYKGFRTITSEIRQRFPQEPQMGYLLQEIEDRRENRNHFFHDHNQAGLTVNEQSCLKAFLDLYNLSSILFGNEFVQKLHANPVVQAQMAVVKLRLRGLWTRVAYNNYQEVLFDTGPLTLQVNSLGYEFCALYEDATRFLKKIRQHFQDLITTRENEITRIGSLTKRNAEHLKKLKHLTEEVELFQDIIKDCLI